jgi:hypothetical protein
VTCNRASAASPVASLSDPLADRLATVAERLKFPWRAGCCGDTP